MGWPDESHARAVRRLEFHLTVSEASDKRLCGSTRNQAIDHARADKQQRIHLLHRRFELAELFKTKLFLDGLKDVRRYAAGKRAIPGRGPSRVTRSASASVPSSPSVRMPQITNVSACSSPRPERQSAVSLAPPPLLSGITESRDRRALIRAAWKFALTAIDARKPAAASAARSLWASSSGGPKSRSVPAISSTQAQAVPWLASQSAERNARRTRTIPRVPQPLFRVSAPAGAIQERFRLQAGSCPGPRL